MAKRNIFVGNYKGGTGKSQTALELAYYLTIKGQKVLVIDCDHQANTTTVLSRGAPPEKRSLAEILIAGDIISRDDISSREIGIDEKCIDYIASGIDTGRLEKKLPDYIVKEYVLKDAIESIEEEYDYIIIDTPPSAELISTCALIACDTVLITSQASYFSMEGVNEMMPVIRRIQANHRMNPDLEVLGIIITLYEETKDCRETIKKLKKEYGELIITPAIRKCTKVKESNRYYLPVQSYAPNSTSAHDFRSVFETLFGAELHRHFATPTNC